MENTWRWTLLRLMATHSPSRGAEDLVKIVLLPLVVTQTLAAKGFG